MTTYYSTRINRSAWGKKYRHCENCHRQFEAKGGWNLHCSEACRILSDHLKLQLQVESLENELETARQEIFRLEKLLQQKDTS